MAKPPSRDARPTRGWGVPAIHPLMGETWMARRRPCPAWVTLLRKHRLGVPGSGVSPAHLGEAFSVHMVHHDDLIVEGPCGASRAARRQRQVVCVMRMEPGAVGYGVAVEPGKRRPPAHLRLRERGRRRGERPPSSSTTLSELRKCLARKRSSSAVGWNGSWCSRSREDELDCERKGAGGRRWAGPQGHGQAASTTLQTPVAPPLFPRLPAASFQQAWLLYIPQNPTCYALAFRKPSLGLPLLVNPLSRPPAAL